MVTLGEVEVDVVAEEEVRHRVPLPAAYIGVRVAAASHAVVVQYLGVPPGVLMEAASIRDVRRRIPRQATALRGAGATTRLIVGGLLRNEGLSIVRP